MTETELANRLREIERQLRPVVERPARDLYESEFRHDDAEMALRTVRGLLGDLVDEGVDGALCAGCRAEEGRALREMAADMRYEARIQGER